MITKTLSLFFYLCIVLFLVAIIKEFDYEELSDVSFSQWHLLLATALGLTFRGWGAFVWLGILKGLGAGRFVNLPKLFYIYSVSWLGRYIPGTIPGMVAKVHFASQYGISRSKIAISTIIEAGLQVLVVSSLSFLLLLLWSQGEVFPAIAQTTLIVVLLLLLILLSPPVFNRVASSAVKIFTGQPLDTDSTVSTKVMIVAAVRYAFGSLIAGLALFYVCKSVYPSLPSSLLLYFIASVNLAGAVGMLAVFLPSGLGVREGVQLMLLAPVVPLEVALLLTVVMRVWSIGVDILFFLIAWAVDRVSGSCAVP